MKKKKTSKKLCELNFKRWNVLSRFKRDFAIDSTQCVLFSLNE